VFAVIGITAAVQAVFSAFFSWFVQLIGSGDLLQSALWMNLSTDIIPRAFLLLCIALACLEDRRLAIPRHWSHWVGVGVWTIDDVWRLFRYLLVYLLGVT
jgi:hypothetical protein